MSLTSPCCPKPRGPLTRGGPWTLLAFPLAFLLTSLLASPLACHRSSAPVPGTPDLKPPPETASSSEPVPFQIAITVDDLPWVGGLPPGETQATGLERIITTLKTMSIPATGFAICARVDALPGLLEQWKAAGLEVGNHSGTHKYIEKLTKEDWEAEISACSHQLETLLGEKTRYFRYPMLRTGESLERRLQGENSLAQLGLRPAPVSVDTGEWVLVKPYVEALSKGESEKARELEAAYLDHLLAAVGHYRALGRAHAGREVSQVLLLHANALLSSQIGPLLMRLREEGARFVSLSQALEDPIYTEEDRYVGPIGLSWLYRIGSLAEESWSWDDGQTEALSRRFTGAADTEPYAIDADLEVYPLLPSAWVVEHKRPYSSNSLVVELDDRSLAMVHTPNTPAATEVVFAWALARFGRRPMALIDGHFHNDACGGNEAALARGIPVYGSDRTAALLISEKGKPGTGTLPPDHIFKLEEGMTLTAGSDHVQVLFPGPAHSPDNVVVYFQEKHLLFGGCMVKEGDSLGYLGAADLEHWPEAVRRIQALDAEWVVPGHGRSCSRDLLENTLRLLREAASGQKAP